MGRPAAVLLAAVALVAGACAGGDGGASERRRVRVVSQNLLHGIACPEESDRCDLPARVELFARQLAASRCPEVVAVQEANERTVGLLRDAIAGICGGAYDVVGDDDPGLDREVVLTTRPVLASARTRLAGPLRTALWVRVAADVGAVDVVATHLASSSDDRPCDSSSCPPPCRADDTLNVCQGRQVAALARRVAAPAGLLIVAGDLNAAAGDETLGVFAQAGFVDTHLAAGNAECDARTGASCTSGRVDDAMTDLRDPASRQTERIDYVLSRPGGGRRCAVVPPTGLFRAGAERRGARGVVFASDHTGVQATIECTTSAAQRREASRLTVPSTTSTTAAAAALDPRDADAIAEAFRAVFDGSVTDVDRKLAALEDGELLRASFVESYERTREVASKVRVRIDSLRAVDRDHVDVVYTLVLDGSAILDHVSGAAVRAGGRWLVTRRTYCDIATQGAASIPEPCRP